MVIYSGGCWGEKFERLKLEGLGIMISSSYQTSFIKKIWKDVPCALDNGAYSDWKKGLNTPFDEHRFLASLSECCRHEIKLDFIVLPDRVGEGKKSLEFSMKWLDRLMFGSYALAVQDGVEPNDIELRDEITTIFVGGTTEWKWKTAKDWIEFAHKNNRKCHIARTGKIEYLNEAKRIGADSCDSTSFIVNDSWHILEEFRSSKQGEMLRSVWIGRK